jgi:iron complex transport system substrate-binding protein
MITASIDRREFFGILAASGLLTACGSDAEVRPSLGATKQVAHPLGTTQVPVAPQRVISLDSNGALQVSLELGAPLIASETLDGVVSIPAYVPKPADGFQSLGFNQLNLERMVQLRPDLIIGNLQRITDNYDQLSAIAPTVPYRNAGAGVDWRDSIKVIAGLLGKEKELDEALSRYLRTAAELGIKHRKTLAGADVALVRFTSEELRILRGPIFGSTVLDHAGIRRTASTKAKGGTPTYLPLSRETVGVLADADVILYILGGGGFNADVTKTFDSYTKGGIWPNLPAVRSGRSYRLDPVAWWDGYSVSAGNACLRELGTVLDKL